jgi:retron-type reverse transcriptase
MLNLPNLYTVTCSTDIAQKLTQLPYKHNYRLLTLDIKDLYINIPTKEIIHITHTILQYNHTERTLQQQTLLTLKVILQQNYFQHNSTICQPTKGVAMGSPISRLIAEIFLQHFENLTIKHHIENKSLIFYTRYVDDILIIYD